MLYASLFFCYNPGMNRLLNIYKTNFGRSILIVISSFLIGYFVSYYVDYYSGSAYAGFSPIRQIDNKSPFIRPLLAYNTPEMAISSPLKDSLKKIINTGENIGSINTASVYYRDLNTGHWFGINQDETYVPASLFKVPLMIAYLKYAENHPYSLQEEIMDDLTTDENANQTIKPYRTLIPGHTYTVSQLIQFMIEYSDNNATVILFKHVDQDVLKQVFSDLDIQIPNNNRTSDFISVANYSFLFRILYNASYLNREMSEKALELLVKIDFTEGLRKSVPGNIPVANKFGEYYLVQDGKVNEHQLHDCGIIYHPKYPYILCIMTKGSSLDNLEKIIQDISKTTYNTIDSIR